MDLSQVGLLFGAGVVGGTFSALAGGASLITFPALLAAGLPPLSAIATNVSSLAPALLLAVLTERSKLPALNPSFLGLVLISAVGTLAGTALLLITPEQLFVVLVPVLLAVGTTLLACSGRVRRWVMARTGRDTPDRRLSAALMVPVSIYSGYFGAGAGVMLVAVTSLETDDYRQANVMKNVMTFTTTAVAATAYTFSGVMDWSAALLIGGGGIIGSFAGVRFARAVPQDGMRVIVVLIGVMLTLAFAWHYWI